jgi:hypothetical protein
MHPHMREVVFLLVSVSHLAQPTWINYVIAAINPILRAAMMKMWMDLVF